MNGYIAIIGRLHNTIYLNYLFIWVSCNRSNNKTKRLTFFLFNIIWVMIRTSCKIYDEELTNDILT